MTYPIQAGLIFPKDKVDWLSTDPNVGRKVHAAYEHTRDWLAAETGYTFDLRFDVKVSTKTARELGAYVADSPYPELPHDDPCGQGLRYGSVLEEIHNLWGGQPFSGVGRFAVLVVNGGGWAGGGLTWHPTEDAFFDDFGKSRPIGTDVGYSVIGDWHFEYAHTGSTAACCVRAYDETFCRRDFAEGLAHEFGHCVGIDVHDHGTKNVILGNTLTAEMKAQYVTRNAAFLRPVTSTTPPPSHPPENPVEPTHPIAGTKKYKIKGEVELEEVV